MGESGKKVGFSFTEKFASDFKKGMQSVTDESGKVSKQIVSGWETAAKTIGVSFAAMAGGAVAFGVKSIGLASDLNEVQNVVDTTFGKGASTIEDFASKAGESFGLSELAAKQYTSTIGAMLKSMGLAEEDTLDMSIALAGLAGDMASFYNLDPSDAFEKLRSGISGETEPLKQLGINMSVANLEAFALSQGITATYDSMTQAEQATLRYQYIMQATADAQGDFSKTSDSLANQQRILQMEVETLSADLGNALLPVALDVVGGLRDMVQWAAENKTTLSVLAVVIAGITTAIIAYSASLSLAAAGMTIATAAGAAFGAVMAFITSPITLVIAAITALIAIGVALYQNWDEVSAWAEKTWEKIQKVFSDGVSAAQKILESIIDFIKNNWASLLLLLVNPFVGAFKLLYDNCEGFRDTVDNMVARVKEAFSNLASGIKDRISSIRASIVNGFQDAVDFIKGLPGQALQWGRDFIQGFSDGITEYAQRIVDRVKGIANKIASYLHFSKPDVGPLRDYETWMPDMVNGLAKTLLDSTPKIESAANAFSKKISSSFSRGIGVHAYVDGGFSDVKAEEQGFRSKFFPNAGTWSPVSWESGTIPLSQQFEQSIQPSTTSLMGTTVIEVPVMIDGREVARASAWYMGEQLAWEER